MAGYTVLRIDTFPTVDDKLTAHILGHVRPKTARHLRPEDGPAVTHLEGDLDHARTRLAELWAARKGRRGPKPFEAVGVILGGPPPYGEGEWPRE